MDVRVDMDDNTTQPFAHSVWAYRSAGWTGAIPLPAGRKYPPPRGYTGWAGVTPSGADVQAWCDGSEAASNIGLHLGPVGDATGEEVIGIDVDAYGGKRGRESLAELIERAGTPLSSTWVSTARADGVSGIRFYRAALPAGRVWIDQPAGQGAGIEMIHRGHRYAVVWPSVHPEGGTYRWLTQPADSDEWMPAAVPSVASLPALPTAWIEVLSRPGEVIRGGPADHADTLTTVDAFRPVESGGDACGPVRTARSAALANLEWERVKAGTVALHPTANGDVWSLVSLGFEGHRGIREALALHWSAFLVARGDVRGAGRDVAATEWWRMVRGAVGKARAKLPDGNIARECPCEAVLFDPQIAPGALAARAEAFPFDLPADTGTPLAEGGVGEALVEVVEQPADPAMDPVEWLAGQLLSPAQMRIRPAPLPLVSGVLALNSLAWLIAAPGSYKSFVALDLAAAVAAGRGWFGRRTHQGPVIYLVAEGVDGMSMRVRAWEHRHGEMGDVRFLPLPVQASHSGQWNALIELCRRVKPALVVLDTQARVTVGMKENDNTDMGVFVDAAERLRGACDACVLTIHHTTKEGGAMRGASALLGAAGTVLELRRVDTGKATLTAAKQKDLRDDLEIALTLDVVPLGVDDITGDALSSLVVRGEVTGAANWQPDWEKNLTENQAMLVGIMAELFPERGATKAEIKRHALVRLRPSDRKPLPKQSYDRAWDGVTGKSGVFAQVQGTQRYVLASLHAEDDHRQQPADVLAALGVWQAPERSFGNGSDSP
jgi:hypothetical protein